MKKIKYCLLSLLSFLICNNVYAQTNDGMLYEVFWQSSNVNVFASDTTYNSMDYNGWMVKSDNNNYIYYCIEPEEYMQNKSDALSNTHTIYNTESTIINNSRLTNNTIEKVKLLAYYGYGYKDNKYNHTNKKWYGITQVEIWKVLRPDIKYVYKESRYGNTNSNLYKSEINELYNLVNNHDKSPSFNNQILTLKKGESIVLKDDNKVLNNFLIENTNYADFKIEENKLYITAKEEVNTTISLKKQQVENKFMLFKGKNLQDIVTRGNVTSPEFKFDIVIEGKDIILKKIDKDTQSFNQNLIGSIFGLYDSNNNLLREIEITKEKEEFILSYGKYYLKELQASDGYDLNKKIYEFEVNETTNNIEIVIDNELIKGDLELTKLDKDTNMPLEGVVIEIYKDDNTLIKEMVTDSNGKILVNDLLKGNYYIKEKTPLKYYRLNDEKIYFSIDKNNEIVQKVMYNEKKEGILQFVKVDKENNKPLKNALIEIYTINDELIFNGKTNELGEIEFDKIKAGGYYIKEKEAPYSYLLNKDKIFFEILEDNEIISLVMTNEKIEIPNTYSSNYSYLSYFTISLFIVLSIKKFYEKNN